MKTHMQHEWDQRAATNPYHWVMSSQNTWDKEEYYKSGIADINRYVLPFFKKGEIKPEHYAAYNVLDIGCGTGRLCRALSEYCAAVTGIDISPEMIQLANKDNSHINNVSFVLGNGKSLQPLQDTTFDFAFSYIVFQHIPDKEVILTYLEELLRVLKPGGRALFQVRGTPGNPPGKVLWFRGFRTFYIALVAWRNFLPIPWFRQYNSVYGACFSRSELDSLLHRLGFSEIYTYFETEKYLWGEVRKPS